MVALRLLGFLRTGAAAAGTAPSLVGVGEPAVSAAAGAVVASAGVAEPPVRAVADAVVAAGAAETVDGAVVRTTLAVKAMPSNGSPLHCTKCEVD